MHGCIPEAQSGIYHFLRLCIHLGRLMIAKWLAECQFLPANKCVGLSRSKHFSKAQQFHPFAQYCPRIERMATGDEVFPNLHRKRIHDLLSLAISYWKLVLQIITQNNSLDRLLRNSESKQLRALTQIVQMAFFLIIVSSSECFDQIRNPIFDFAEHLFCQRLWSWYITQDHTPCISQWAILINHIFCTCFNQIWNLFFKLIHLSKYVQKTCIPKKCMQWIFTVSKRNMAPSSSADKFTKHNRDSLDTVASGSSANRLRAVTISLHL